MALNVSAEQRDLLPLEDEGHAIQSDGPLPSDEEDHDPGNINEPVPADHIEPDLQPLDDVPAPSQALSEEVRGLLGSEGVAHQASNFSLHEDIATRWGSILTQGLSQDTLAGLVSKYELPNNCSALKPPSANEIVLAAMNEASINRDNRISGSQLLLGTALAALGSLMNSLLEKAKENVKEIEPLSDACRILCSIFHGNSLSRRSLIIPGLNKDMKALLEKRPISSNLFGDDLQEEVRSSKATQKSAAEMKIVKPKPTNSLNSRGPLRRILPAARQSGQKSARPFQRNRPTVSRPYRRPNLSKYSTRRN